MIKVSYDNENGSRITRKYDNISTFIMELESDEIDIPMLDYENVEIEGYINCGCNAKAHFETIGMAYNYYK